MDTSFNSVLEAYFCVPHIVFWPMFFTYVVVCVLGRFKGVFSLLFTYYCHFNLFSGSMPNGLALF
jgi:hypothetical protein